MLDLLPKPLTSDTFKVVVLVRLRKTIPEIGPSGRKLTVMKLRNGNNKLDLIVLFGERLWGDTMGR